jgi:type VI protein secretion system component VasF
MDIELQQRFDQQDKEIAEIKQRLHKVDRHFFWGRVFIWVNVLLFVVPLIVAYFFLKPMLEQGIGTLINPSADGQINPMNADAVKNLLDQYKQLQ